MVRLQHLKHIRELFWLVAKHIAQIPCSCWCCKVSDMQVHLHAQTRSTGCCEQTRALISYMFDLPHKMFWCVSLFAGNCWSTCSWTNLGVKTSNSCFLACTGKYVLWTNDLFPMYQIYGKLTFFLKRNLFAVHLAPSPWKFQPRPLEPPFCLLKWFLQCCFFLMTALNRCGSLGTCAPIVGCHCMHTMTPTAWWYTDMLKGLNHRGFFVENDGAAKGQRMEMDHATKSVEDFCFLLSVR